MIICYLHNAEMMKIVQGNLLAYANFILAYTLL